MKTKLALFLATAALILIACGKDKFSTEPQVKVKSIAPETVQQGDRIKLEGSFTDKEGDLDSVYIVYKWYEGDIVRRKDTIRTSLSALEIPVNLKEGFINLDFSYGRQVDGVALLTPTPSIRDTTATLGLLLVDKAGHRSNYSESDRIRLVKF